MQLRENGAYIFNLTNSEKVTRLTRDNSQVDNISKAIVSYDFPYGEEALDNTLRFVKILKRKGANLKTIGPISLEILKNGLGKANRPKDYNDAVCHMEVRPWDVAAATCILRELGCDVYSLKENAMPITIEELTDRNAKIAFVATSSKDLLTTLYNDYNYIIYDCEEIFKEVYFKSKAAQFQNRLAAELAKIEDENNKKDGD